MGSSKRTVRKSALRKIEAERWDDFSQVTREERRKRKEKHEAWLRHTRKTYDKISRNSLEELFSKDWSRSDVGYPDWFQLFARTMASPKKKQEAKDRLGYLVLTVFDIAPGLVIEEYFSACKLLACLDWVRPLDTWKPKGKSNSSHYRSLVDHLLVKYPVPRLIYSLADSDTSLNWMRLFALVASGEKVARCFDGSILQHPRIPMTKRMCHHLMQISDEDDFIKGVRMAQITALGGNQKLAGAINNTFLGLNLYSDEDFWFTVTRWFCEQPDVDYNQVGPLLDFIQNMHVNNTSYSTKGRTIRSLARAMEEWHRQLAIAQKLDGIKFTKSGFEEGVWELVGQHGGKKRKFLWTMEEVLTSKALHEEGKNMKHCVYSYARKIQDSSCSIWSLKMNGGRMLTVEVMHSKRTIVQARGKCNRPPKQHELSVIRRWAQENVLKTDINKYW